MVKIVAITQGAGELTNRVAQDVVSYITRVSAPQNQLKFETAPKLLAYCIKHGHWSPFEHANMTLEIETSRGIAAQILRHRSFKFQEFSQRYAEAHEMVEYEARRQDLKNRQNSIDDLSQDVKDMFIGFQRDLWALAHQYYSTCLKNGIAKECARFLLPLNTKTRLYMTGDVRSWIHYIQLRSDLSSQKEHREIALDCQRIFKEQFPDIAEALGWENHDNASIVISS